MKRTSKVSKQYRERVIRNAKPENGKSKSKKDKGKSPSGKLPQSSSCHFNITTAERERKQKIKTCLSNKRRWNKKQN